MICELSMQVVKPVVFKTSLASVHSEKTVITVKAASHFKEIDRKFILIIACPTHELLRL